MAQSKANVGSFGARRSLLRCLPAAPMERRSGPVGTACAPGLVGLTGAGTGVRDGYSIRVEPPAVVPRALAAFPVWRAQAGGRLGVIVRSTRSAPSGQLAWPGVCVTER